MSQIPKIHNKYCKKCNSYKLLTLSIIKTKATTNLKKINRRRMNKYLTRGPGGKFTKTPAKSNKTSGKKFNLLLTCNTCGAKRNWARRRSLKLIINK